MRSFSYLYETQATGQLDIEDIGNCAIVAYNSRQYLRYILIVTTVQGQTRIVFSGPHWTELEQPCYDYSYTFQSFQFSQAKIGRVIERFLNGKFYIDQAECVEKEEALEYIPDVRRYIQDD